MANFYIIEPPYVSTAGIAMDEDGVGGWNGAQLCATCDPTLCDVADVCGADACRAESGRATTVTATVALTADEGCSGITCTEYTDPTYPCGEEITCPLVPRCVPCACANGSWVLTQYSGFSYGAGTDCQYRYSKSHVDGYVNCCATGVNHNFSVTLTLYGTGNGPGGATAQAYVILSGSGAAYGYYYSVIPDCTSFSISIPITTGCGGSVGFVA